MSDALNLLHPVVREWFASRFQEPSPPQSLVWPAIARGENVLAVAPTGSGKTLAAFLMCLSRLLEEAESGEGGLGQGVQVLYISPLKALNNDIMRNLQDPLRGIYALGQAAGVRLPEITADVRTGDTPPSRRAAMLKRPPSILVTTPETLYLLLTGPKSRETLRTVRYVVVDEIHALCSGKRGVHLSLSLERLVDTAGREPLRIGLSATQRPLERVAAFLGGQGTDGVPRHVTICDAGARKAMDLSVVSPVSNWSGLDARGVWDAIGDTVLELVRAHVSTIVFVNSRQVAERLSRRLNELAGEQLALCHHGSVSRELREEAEEKLKRGSLRCLVATSTMELGIDVGFVDLVIQAESPKSVAGGLQRVGRAGHLLHATSKGRILPKTRMDLVECTALAGLMVEGAIEETRVPQGCLDVLSQQVVAMVSLADCTVDGLVETAKRSYCYRTLTRDDMVRVLGMLTGRTVGGPGGPRPRVIWDRVTDRVTKTDGSRFVALRNAGTIPDRGQYTVTLSDGEMRIGELDEVFVYESRVGDTFTLGNSVYRIDDVTSDKVKVSLSSSGAARPPFWKGDLVGRAYGLSLHMGRFVRELVPLVSAGDTAAVSEFVAQRCVVDDLALKGLTELVLDQTRVTGAFPDDRTIVVEYFQDEYGDGKGVIHSIFGSKVNYCLSRLMSRRILSEYFVEPDCVRMDDGVLYALPKAVNLDLAAVLRAVASGDVEADLMAELRSTPVFATSFRQCAVRSLVFSRPRHGRMPLWMARLKAQPLLDEAMSTGGKRHPLVDEALRECMEDILDLAALLEVTRAIRIGTISIVESRGKAPSTLARSFTYDFVGIHMYQDPAATASGPDELLPSSASPWLEEPLVVSEVARELNPLAVFADGSRDALLLAVDAGGEVALEEARSRWGDAAEAWATELEAAHVVRRELRGWREWLVPADAATAEARVGDPTAQMRRACARWTPMTAGAVAERYAVTSGEAEKALASLEREGVVRRLPSGVGSGLDRWCAPEVADEITQRSLAYRRRSLAPVALLDAARFLLSWSGLSGWSAAVSVDGPEGVLAAMRQLQGTYLTIGAWEGMVLPLRMPRYRREWLDELCASGQVVWVARGDSGGRDRAEPKVAFFTPDDFGLLVPGSGGPSPDSELSPEEESALDALVSKGAAFASAISRQLGIPSPEALTVLNSLMLKGLVSNDSVSALRYWKGLRKGSSSPRTMVVGRWFALRGVSPGPQPQGALPSREGWIAQLLSRTGLLTRELVDDQEEHPSFSQLEPELKRMEEAGTVRRGYLATGLSGLQFASEDALKLLQRTTLPPGAALVPLADPAARILTLWLQSEGWSVGKMATSHVVVVNGDPTLLVESNGGRVTPLGTPSNEDLRASAGELRHIADLLRGMGSRSRLEVKTWGGSPVLEGEGAEILGDVGFTRGVNSMLMW